MDSNSKVDSSIDVLMFEGSNFCLTYFLLLVFVGNGEGATALNFESFTSLLIPPPRHPKFFFFMEMEYHLH